MNSDDDIVDEEITSSPKGHNHAIHPHSSPHTYTTSSSSTLSNPSPRDHLSSISAAMDDLQGAMTSSPRDINENEDPQRALQYYKQQLKMSIEVGEMLLSQVRQYTSSEPSTVRPGIRHQPLITDTPLHSSPSSSSSIQQRLDTAREQIRILRSEKDDLYAHLQQRQEQVNSLRSRLRVVESQASEYAQQMAVQDQEAATLRRENTALRTHVDRLVNALGSMQEEQAAALEYPDDLPIHRTEGIDGIPSNRGRSSIPQPHSNAPDTQRRRRASLSANSTPRRGDTDRRRVGTSLWWLEEPGTPSTGNGRSEHNDSDTRVNNNVFDEHAPLTYTAEGSENSLSSSLGEDRILTLEDTVSRIRQENQDLWTENEELQAKVEETNRILTHTQQRLRTAHITQGSAVPVGRSGRRCARCGWEGSNEDDLEIMPHGWDENPEESDDKGYNTDNDGDIRIRVKRDLNGRDRDWDGYGRQGQDNRMEEPYRNHRDNLNRSSFSMNNSLADALGPEETRRLEQGEDGSNSGAGDEEWENESRGTSMDTHMDCDTDSRDDDQQSATADCIVHGDSIRKRVGQVMCHLVGRVMVFISIPVRVVLKPIHPSSFQQGSGSTGTTIPQEPVSRALSLDLTQV